MYHPDVCLNGRRAGGTCCLDLRNGLYDLIGCTNYLKFYGNHLQTWSLLEWEFYLVGTLNRCTIVLLYIKMLSKGLTDRLWFPAVMFQCSELSSCPSRLQPGMRSWPVAEACLITMEVCMHLYSVSVCMVYCFHYTTHWYLTLGLVMGLIVWYVWPQEW